MISIRRASSTQDFEAAAALCKALGDWDAAEVPAYGVAPEEVLALFHSETADSLAAKFSVAGAGFLLAAADRTPAGCLAFDPFDDATVELHKFFVDERFRGRGVGRALMRAALAEIADGSRRKVVIHTTFYMHGAVAIYEAFGFTRCPPFRATPAGIAHTDLFMSRMI